MNDQPSSLFVALSQDFLCGSGEPASYPTILMISDNEDEVTVALRDKLERDDPCPSVSQTKFWVIEFLVGLSLSLAVPVGDPTDDPELDAVDHRLDPDLDDAPLEPGQPQPCRILEFRLPKEV